tara:strand:+ start:1644 stop:1868 length:225 start_codon:yes stop_codon:yes gene_type:complete
MKILYDKEVDIVDIDLEHPIKPGRYKEAWELEEGPILCPVDKNDKLLSIEILSASKILNKKVLMNAEQASHKKK